MIVRDCDQALIRMAVLSFDPSERRRVVYKWASKAACMSCDVDAYCQYVEGGVRWVDSV